jgi:predicted Zn-ribbon and HTH transcriptional regulator
VLATKIVVQRDFPGDCVMPGTIQGVGEPTTRREQIIGVLAGAAWEFEALRRQLEMTVRDLEDDLRHVERSVRARGQRLRVDGAECQYCGFRLTSGALHPPGRCPSCRGHHLLGPWLRIA